jgi:hypothetical protein
MKTGKKDRAYVIDPTRADQAGPSERDSSSPDDNTIYIYVDTVNPPPGNQDIPSADGNITDPNAALNILVDALVEEEAHLDYGLEEIHAWIERYSRLLRKAMREEWNKRRLRMKAAAPPGRGEPVGVHRRDLDFGAWCP